MLVGNYQSILLGCRYTNILSIYSPFHIKKKILLKKMQKLSSYFNKYNIIAGSGLAFGGMYQAYLYQQANASSSQVSDSKLDKLAGDLEVLKAGQSELLSLHESSISVEKGSQLEELLRKLIGCNSSTKASIEKTQGLLSKLDKSIAGRSEIQTSVDESLGRVSEESSVLDAVLKLIKEGGSGFGSNGGSSSQFVSDFYVKYQEFLSGLDIFSLNAVAHILFCIFILYCICSIIFIIYGDKFIVYLKIEEKYPKFAKIINYRRKFQNYFINLNLLLIALSCLAVIGFHLVILFH